MIKFFWKYFEIHCQIRKTYHLMFNKKFDLANKDTNRKIGKTEFIYCICGSKNGSSNSTVNIGEVWGDVSRAHAKGAMHVLLGICNQNSNTVIYEKCCSYLFISIFISKVAKHVLYKASSHLVRLFSLFETWDGQVFTYIGSSIRSVLYLK